MCRYILLVLFLLGFSFSSQATEVEAVLGWAGQQKIGFPVTGVVEGKVFNVGAKVDLNDVLAKLNIQPFKYKINRCQAKINRLIPFVADAKLEKEHAQELYDRTVLSEVELQKAKDRYVAAVAGQMVEKQSCLLEKWNADHAQIKSSTSAYVIGSNVVSGMVISDENKADVYFELASSKQAVASAWLSSEQKSHLNIGDPINVSIDQQVIPASILSIQMYPNEKNKYRVDAIFYYMKTVEPGKIMKLKY